MKAAERTAAARVGLSQRRAAPLRTRLHGDKLVQYATSSSDVHTLDLDGREDSASGASRQSPATSRSAADNFTTRARATLGRQSRRARTHRRRKSQRDATRGDEPRTSTPRGGEGASACRDDSGARRATDRKEDARSARIEWTVRTVPSDETVNLKEWATCYVAFLVRAQSRLEKEKTAA